MTCRTCCRQARQTGPADVADAGAPPLEPVDGSGLRVAVVAASWHRQVTDGLVAGALRRLTESGVSDPVLVRVAGSFELPVVTAALVRTHDAVVALGVVIRGGTPHFDHVCRVVTDGLSAVARESGVPVGLGLLTCDTERQAVDRAGLPGSSEDKGAEAAAAAVHTARVLRALSSTTAPAGTPTDSPRG